jgi:sugar phosphate permease
MLSDAVSTRTLMTSGALLAALATLLFGVTQDVSLLVVSRALEGLAAAELRVRVEAGLEG